jgi:hypothetical protein
MAWSWLPVGAAPVSFKTFGGQWRGKARVLTGHS